jgi:uncharacterized membrane protein
MKIRHMVAVITVCWLGIITHCIWPPGYGRAGEIAIIGAFVLAGGFVIAMVRSAEREHTQRRIDNARRARANLSPDRPRPRWLHSVPAEEPVQQRPTAWQ